jgi:hypothetical protein
MQRPHPLYMSLQSARMMDTYNRVHPHAKRATWKKARRARQTRLDLCRGTHKRDHKCAAPFHSRKLTLVSEQAGGCRRIERHIRTHACGY